MAAETRPTLEVRVFGRLRVTRAGTDIRVPYGKESTVLQRLVLNGGSIHRERLMEELWPDCPIEQSAPLLRTVLSRLRRRTGARIVARGGSVDLLDPYWCDLDEFIRKATRALSGDAGVEEARRLCLEAQALWFGSPLEEHCYRPWAESLRGRANDLRDRMWLLLDA